MNEKNIYYHCSNNDFDEFGLHDNKLYKEIDIPGWFFTKDLNYAKTFGNIIYTVHLDINKTLDAENNLHLELIKDQINELGLNEEEVLDEEFYNSYPYWTCTSAYFAAEENGFDSVIIQEELEKEVLAICVLDINKIKIINKTMNKNLKIQESLNMLEKLTGKKVELVEAIHYDDCPNCSGEGRDKENLCGECWGTGYVKVSDEMLQETEVEPKMLTDEDIVSAQEFAIVLSDKIKKSVDGWLSSHFGFDVNEDDLNGYRNTLLSFISLRLKDKPKLQEGMFTGFKKALSFDTTYQSKQDAWNKINDYITKKYKNIKVKSSFNSTFTNGARDIKIDLDKVNTSKKTIELNGTIVPMDDLISSVEKILKQNKFI